SVIAVTLSGTAYSRTGSRVPGESSACASTAPASLRTTRAASIGDPMRSANTSKRTFVFGTTATRYLSSSPGVLSLPHTPTRPAGNSSGLPGVVGSTNSVRELTSTNGRGPLHAPPFGQSSGSTGPRTVGRSIFAEVEPNSSTLLVSFVTTGG